MLDRDESAEGASYAYGQAAGGPASAASKTSGASRRGPPRRPRPQVLGGLAGTTRNRRGRSASRRFRRRACRPGGVRAAFSSRKQRDGGPLPGGRRSCRLTPVHRSWRVRLRRRLTWPSPLRCSPTPASGSHQSGQLAAERRRSFTQAAMLSRQRRHKSMPISESPSGASGSVAISRLISLLRLRQYGLHSPRTLVRMPSAWWMTANT